MGLSSDTGLMYGTGLNWLDGGLGEAGLINPIIIPQTVMAAEDDSPMITEDDNPMVTE